MTTELFANDNFPTSATVDPEHELEWVINAVIKPQIPDILDTLEKSLELMRSEESFKLPITSKDEFAASPSLHPGNSTDNNKNNSSNSNNGILKGTITRKQGAITEYQLLVQFPKFHKNQPQMIQLNKPKNDFSKATSGDSTNNDEQLTKNEIELEQLVSTIKYMEIAIEILKNLLQTTDIHDFRKLFSELNKLFIVMINNLNKPISLLQFPLFKNPLIQQLESQHHLIVPEILIISNEIFLEFRCLEKFNKKPWSVINQEGQSTSDLIKLELRNPEKKLTDILACHKINIVEPTFFHSIIMNYSSSGSQEYHNVTLTEAQDILNRSVTYQNQLYLEMEKVIVRTSDPYLITVCSKLVALQKTIYTAHSNLQFV